MERLKAVGTPAVILLSEYARRVQDMTRALGESFAGQNQVTLVLNSENPVVQSIPTLPKEDQELVCRHIYDLAMLAHRPLSAEQMQAFVARNVKILELLTKQESK